MEETFIDNECKDENYKLSKIKIEQFFIDEKLILKWLDIFAPLYFTTTLEIVEGNFERTFFFEILLKKVENQKRKKKLFGFGSGHNCPTKKLTGQIWSKNLKIYFLVALGVFT